MLRVFLLPKTFKKKPTSKNEQKHRFNAIKVFQWYKLHQKQKNRLKQLKSRQENKILTKSKTINFKAQKI